MVSRHEEKASRCEQYLGERKPSTWSRMIGGIRLFRGSGQEHNVSDFNPMGPATGVSLIESNGNFALEATLTSAKALALWDRISKNMV